MIVRGTGVGSMQIALVLIASRFRGAESLGRTPTGVLYVGSALKAAGYEPKIFHISASEIEASAKDIASKSPLFVGFSVFTGYSVLTSAIMSRLLKRLSLHTPIVWGGVHPSLTPEQCLREPYIDIVVRGEGERTAVELADALEKGKDISQVKGIGYKDAKGNIRLTEPRPLSKNPDDFKIDWDLIDVRRYLRPAPSWGAKRTFCLVTSRGCPWSCGFCYNLAFNQRRWRGHSEEYVVSEIKYLAEQYGVDGLIFDDDDFFANRERSLRILRAVDLPWWGEVRIDYVVRERSLPKRLQQTNCKCIFFGFESGNPRVLRQVVNKGFGVDDIVRGTQYMAEVPEIMLKASCIVGMPTESPAEINDTIRLAVKLSEIHPNIGFNIGLFLPYPGVPLFDVAVKEGFIPPAKLEDWAKWDILSGEMSPTWLPWATPRQVQDFKLAHEYMGVMSGEAFGWKKNPIGRLLRKWVKLRLVNQNFMFPYDLKLLLAIRRAAKYRTESSTDEAASGSLQYDYLEDGHRD